ncbi:acyl-CoA synthetase [Auriculariales sp. MPI-PUGE-AT-0066]|nr:acyl-CoA synthetase [Auriculariales sp. MPI-PUGE-AT-0066]
MRTLVAGRPISSPLIHFAVRSLRLAQPLSQLQACTHRSLATGLLTKSRVAGPLTPPLSTHTLPSFYRSHLLEKYWDRSALISVHEPRTVHSQDGRGLCQLSDAKHIHWTFEELDKHVVALAQGLVQNLGIQKGDTVAAVMGNCSAYAALQWTCAQIGAVLVTLNPAYKMHEIVSMLNLTTPKALFLVPTLRGRDYVTDLLRAIPQLGERSLQAGELKAESIPSLSSVVLVDNVSYSPTSPDLWLQFCKQVPGALKFQSTFLWDEDARSLPKQEELDRHDVINLQFTSGTTGLPKAVSLTHSNLLNNALSIGACMRLQPGDKLCNVPPLFHCFGLVLGNLATWTHAGCIVYAAESFDPEANLKAIVDEECTAIHGVPTHFLGLLDALEKNPKMGRRLKEIGKLRTGIAAGSPVPIELMRKLIDRLGLTDLSNAYGMSETSPVSFQTTPDDPLIKRVETVGRVQPHVKAKLVDTEGRTVPIGEPGELCVAGYLLQKGYWNDLKQTQEVVRTHPDEEVNEDQGTVWMHTGDVGIMDKEGYLRIVGRNKDVIIRGGENLFPVQIENVLGEHPDVHEVSVVAVQDERFGEVVGAWVRLRQAAQDKVSGKELREWVASKMNSQQNAPAWVWYLRGEEELPKTASGKVQKNVLREWSAERKTRGENEIQ